MGPQFGAQVFIDRSDVPVQFEYLITIAGTYKCSVFMNGLSILRSLFDLAVSSGILSHRHSIVRGKGLSNHVAGDSVSVLYMPYFLQ